MNDKERHRQGAQKSRQRSGLYDMHGAVQGSGRKESGKGQRAVSFRATDSRRQVLPHRRGRRIARAACKVVTILLTAVAAMVLGWCAGALDSPSWWPVVGLFVSGLWLALVAYANGLLSFKL